MSDQISYRTNENLKSKELVALYNDAGWTTYSVNPDLLEKAVSNSLYLLAAYDKDKLVGLIRVVGDGLTIVYIQDILVLKSHQRTKIGTTLMQMTLLQFAAVRQKVLLTDDNPKVRAFYESLGFLSCDDGRLIAFAKLENQV